MSVYSSLSTASTPSSRGNAESLAERLGVLRKKSVALEESIVSNSQEQEKAKSNIQKIKQLIQLQREEKELGRERLVQLEQTVRELEERKDLLEQKVRTQQSALRKLLLGLEASVQPEGEKEKSVDEMPRRKLLANLLTHALKEFEALRIDLDDANKLETRIGDERHQIAYLFQDLKEQESVLALNQELQAELLKKKRREHLFQLENYRKLKTAESQVEQLIQEFNGRRELEKIAEAEKATARALSQSEFAHLRGKLPLPILNGKVISSFGRAFDPDSKLYVFKKGIDIQGRNKEVVRSVYSGKIAYSGELPNYGRVAIIDHGDHYYSLCAHLGELTKRPGEWVSSGEEIGKTDELGTPIYFEVRAHNVAVNPLQWVSE